MDADLAALVRDRYSALLARAFLLTGSRSDAQDLVQETLARCCLAWRRGAADDPDAYALRVMINLSKTMWYRRRARESAERLLPRESAVDETAQLDLKDAVWKALATLPIRQRLTLVLRYYEDMSETQVAAALGVSVGTVRSQTARALQRLRNSVRVVELMGDHG